jgi:flagellar biosynthesis chaperone FliJ
MEVAVQTRLNYLQRFKDTAAYRIKHLQKQVEESVHQNELDKINRKYEDVVEKYRDLLEQQHAYVQQTEQSSLLSVEYFSFLFIDFKEKSIDFSRKTIVD